MGLRPASSSSRYLEQESDSEDFMGLIATSCAQRQPFSKELGNPNGLSLLQSLMADPVARTSWTEKQSDGYSLLEELPDALPALPHQDAASKLTDIYFEHCNFYSPIFSSKEEFLSMIQPLYNECTSDRASTIIRFRALVVFGTSILLLNRVDFSVPASKSGSYFRAATRIFAQNPDLACTGDLQHLVNLLLIIQYCCFASNITAAWHFIGLATRLAIEISLHKEAAASPLSDQFSVNERRWLFWSLYTFERNLCVIIGRPFSIPDEAIDTPLPAASANDTQRALSIHLLKLRRLESEIYATLNGNQPSNGAILHKGVWRDNIQLRLQEWHSSVPPTQQSTPLAPRDMFNGFLYNQLVLLYYPSRHFSNPTASDLAILVKAATDSINCYRRTFRAGELRFFWRTAHNLFRSGVAVVFCAQPYLMDLIPGFDREDAVASINSCSSLLWGMVERYPAGQAYRDIFDRLASSALSTKHQERGHENSAFSKVSADSSSVFSGLGLDLDATLFPSTAFDTLQWGFRDPSEML